MVVGETHRFLGNPHSMPLTLKAPHNNKKWVEVLIVLFARWRWYSLKKKPPFKKRTWYRHKPWRNAEQKNMLHRRVQQSKGMKHLCMVSTTTGLSQRLQLGYTPEVSHGTWKSAPRKGDSFWKPSFSGSMLNFWGVCKKNSLVAKGSGRNKATPTKNRDHFSKKRVIWALLTSSLYRAGWPWSSKCYRGNISINLETYYYKFDQSSEQIPNLQIASLEVLELLVKLDRCIF